MIEAKHYEMPCSGGGDYYGSPELGIFDIDQPTAEFIVRMAAFVKANDLYKVERFDYRIEWYQGEGCEGEDEDQPKIEREIEGGMETLSKMRSECDAINITSTDFHFSCYRKHCDDKIETDDAFIKELAAHFGLAWEDPYAKLPG